MSQEKPRSGIGQERLYKLPLVLDPQPEGGHTVRGRRLRSDSDIDLAVEGMSPERFYRIVGDLSTDGGRAIDLVRLETAREWLRKIIALEGVLLADDRS